MVNCKMNERFCACEQGIRFGLFLRRWSVCHTLSLMTTEATSWGCSGPIRTPGTTRGGQDSAVTVSVLQRRSLYLTRLLNVIIISTMYNVTYPLQVVGHVTTSWITGGVHCCQKLTWYTHPGSRTHEWIRGSVYRPLWVDLNETTLRENRTSYKIIYVKKDIKEARFTAFGFIRPFLVYTRT